MIAASSTRRSLEHATGRPASVTLAAFPSYHLKVFLTPPWPEIYVTDRERRHDYDKAVDEYDRLVAAYGELGYDPIILPKITVAERAGFVLSRLT